MRPFLAIVLTIGLLFIEVDSVACSCGRVGIIKNKNSVDYVFRGRVISVLDSLKQDTTTRNNEIINYRITKYEFSIIKAYKGLKKTDTIDLFQGMTDCEVTFEKGETYIVYAHFNSQKLHYRLTDQETDPYLTTHLCTRTKKTSILTFWESLILWLT